MEIDSLQSVGMFRIGVEHETSCIYRVTYTAVAPEASGAAQYEPRSAPSTASIPPKEFPAAAILLDWMNYCFFNHDSAAI
jgi:hypothetical protein